MAAFHPLPTLTARSPSPRRPRLSGAEERNWLAGLQLQLQTIPKYRHKFVWAIFRTDRDAQPRLKLQECPLAYGTSTRRASSELHFPEAKPT
jgi:hypothetical protein